MEDDEEQIIEFLTLFYRAIEYSYGAEPPAQFRLSHLSRRSEPLYHDYVFR